MFSTTQLSGCLYLKAVKKLTVYRKNCVGEMTVDRSGVLISSCVRLRLAPMLSFGTGPAESRLESSEQKAKEVFGMRRKIQLRKMKWESTAGFRHSLWRGHCR
jgi:hypothetical protein